LHVPDHIVEIADRVGDLVGVVGQQTVTDARFWLSCRIRVVLSRSAETRIDRFLTVEKMSVLLSPRTEKAATV
jgi:hypothetical protein